MERDDEDAEPTDVQRVEFARSRLNEVLEGMSDSDDVPVHMAYELQYTDGRTAYVVSKHRGYFFTEIRADVRGPYQSYEQAREASYDGSVEDSAAIPDAEILARWRRE